MNQEIQKLIDRLSDNNIPHVAVNNVFFGEDTVQVFYPSKEDPKIDVVCHHGCYGYEKGLLELMIRTTGEIMGRLNADTAFNVIKNYDENGQ